MKNTRRAPAHLSAEARSLWRNLLADYEISDAGGLAILLQACEAFDRLRAAQAAISEGGPMVVDRFMQPKAHPMLTVERDSRSAFLQAIKQLGLDIEPLRGTPGRVPGR